MPGHVDVLDWSSRAGRQFYCPSSIVFRKAVAVETILILGTHLSYTAFCKTNYLGAYERFSDRDSPLNKMGEKPKVIGTDN